MNIRTNILTLGIAIATFFALASCKERPAEGDAKEHDSASSAADKHDQHNEHADEVTLSAEAIQRYGIRVDLVAKHVLIATLSAPARVSFNTEAMAHVGSPLRGRVADLKVRLGDLVKKGDTMLVIESPELGEAQSDYLQKRSSAQSAGPAADLARNAYERAKGLYDKSQGIALTEVQKREAEYRGAQAALLAAQTSAMSAENKLHLLGMDQKAVDELATGGKVAPRFAITAPIAGRVVEREVTLGELVGPDREALLVLADMDTLWVLADVPESRLQDIAAGANARITVGPGGGASIDGTLAFISHSIDPLTRSAQARVEVRSERLLLRPGMFARVEIETGPTGAKAEAVLSVPDEAVQTVEGGTAVFVPVAGEENTFVKRPVKVGRAVGGMAPVLSGLVEGESVVVSGSFILKAELGKGSAEHEH